MELTIDQALQQGRAAHKEGKLQEAERLYRAILQAQPAHPHANHNLGVIAVSANKAEAALRLFKTALEANPKILQFWLSYIDTLIRENHLETAKQVIVQGKNKGINSKKFDALNQQLLLASNNELPSQSQLNNLLEQYQKGQYGDAEKLAISITEKFPRHHFSWKILGAVFKQTGRVTESLGANQRAAHLDPEDAEVHSNLGVALKELGRIEEAEASYRRAIELKPDYVEAHSNLGNTLKDLGRLEEAEASYRQAISLKNDFAEAHNNLGNTLQELSRLEEAEASYRQAIAFKPDLADVLWNLSSLAKTIVDAEHWVGKCLKADANHVQAKLMKAALRFYQGDRADFD
ncbi:MAG: tetratricopeptide repeat protein, partial [Pseudomonadota bacterium]|nr:tetratricopeptide repeat protein [Pseudomonadota bacterium]